MKIMAAWLAGAAVTLAAAMAMAEEPAPARSESAAAPLEKVRPEREWNHSFYLGFAYGPTTLKTDGKQREVSGIDFTFDADADDLGMEAFGGYWITEHVGVEIGGRDYGQVEVPFQFTDPHDGDAGTGESVVEMGGFNVSLMVGFDVIESLQVVVRTGFLAWTEDFESRFDMPGRAAEYRTYSESGTGMTYGAGLVYRFSPGWSLEGRYELAAFDDDTVSLASVGLSYDFLGLCRD